MLSEADVTVRFDEIIADLNTLPSGDRAGAYPATMWAVILGATASAMNLIRLVFGEKSLHAEMLHETMQDPYWARRCFPAAMVKGIVQSARDDFAGGYYGSMQTRIVAEVFGDLLEMAEHLQKETSHIPAAMLAGAVLEDALRRLCDAREVDREGCSGINALNDRLKAAEVYDKPLWRRIQGWFDLRNQVDHHDFSTPDEVDAQAVGHMIEGIGVLIVGHLSNGRAGT